MISYDQYCPESRQKCATPYECADGCIAAKEMIEEDLPNRITMLMSFKDICVDVLCTVVWWSGIIALVALVAVTAGLFFGFFL